MILNLSHFKSHFVHSVNFSPVEIQDLAFDYFQDTDTLEEVHLGMGTLVHKQLTKKSIESKG